MREPQRVALFLATLAIMSLMLFYAFVGVAALHLTQPHSSTLGGCIKEAGTTWCRLEQ